MRYQIKILLTAFFILVFWTLRAQKNVYPEVGKPCPDFALNNVDYYTTAKVSLKDFRGKWLLVDFWSSHCIACIRSFPETNELQQKFKGRVQFMLVGYKDATIKGLYERYRSRYHLALPVAYDSALFRRFGVWSQPQVLWINPKGIVVGITDGLQVNEANISALLEGKDPGLVEKLDVQKNDPEKDTKYPFTAGKPFLINGNGGSDTDFLYRSVLSAWNRDMKLFNTGYFRTYPANNFLVSGATLNQLYMMAYGDTIDVLPIPGTKNNYGRYWAGVLLEAADSALFQYDVDKVKNLFSYSLTVPPAKADKIYMQHMMQQDLKNYFGFDVSVETRKMPCYYLVATDGAREKLATKGGKTELKGNFLVGCELINQPVQQVINALWAVRQRGPLFYDSTGIKGHIDLTLEKGTYHFDEALESLRKNGLDLIKGEHEMKVIVVREPARVAGK